MKSCGSGALRLGVQALVWLQRPCEGDGGNQSKAHREEHEVSRNPLRREGRSVSAVPVVNARSRKSFCAGAPGACGHPAFPVPSCFSRAMNDAKLGRTASREYGLVSIPPSLRGASATWQSRVVCVALDCRVALLLAMTEHVV